MYERVGARWNELGFSGNPPALAVFEDAAPDARVD
jgi:hypothetical protein